MVFKSMRGKLKLKLTRADWLAIRRMYLLEYMKPAEIAAELKLPEEHYNLLRARMTARGLPKEKRRREGLILAKNTKTMNKQDSEELAKSEAFSHQAEEMVEKGFKLARGTENAKDFSALASGTRSFLDVYKQSRGLITDANAPGRQSAMNVFFVREVEAPSAEQMKKAEVIEVKEVAEPAGIF